MLLVKSLLISAVAAFRGAVPGFSPGLLIAFHVRRSRLTWILLVTVPFWISYLLRIFSWKVVLGFGGALNSGLIALGLIERPIEALLYNQFAVILALAHSWSAFAVLPIYVSLQKIEPHLLEAALDLGDSSIQRFRRVVLPLAMPGLLAAFLLVFVPTMGDYITPSLVGGTEGTMVGNAYRDPLRQAERRPARRSAVCHDHGLSCSCRRADARRGSAERLVAGARMKARGSLSTPGPIWRSYTRRSCSCRVLVQQPAVSLLSAARMTLKWYAEMAANAQMSRALWNRSASSFRLRSSRPDWA
jgi:ABC-type spermidine/putrescine transport system permease subunit II